MITVFAYWFTRWSVCSSRARIAPWLVPWPARQPAKDTCTFAYSSAAAQQILPETVLKFRSIQYLLLAGWQEGWITGWALAWVMPPVTGWGDVRESNSEVARPGQARPRRLQNTTKNYQKLPLPRFGLLFWDIWSIWSILIFSIYAVRSLNLLNFMAKMFHMGWLKFITWAIFDYFLSVTYFTFMLSLILICVTLAHAFRIIMWYKNTCLHNWSLFNYYRTVSMNYKNY